MKHFSVLILVVLTLALAAPAMAAPTYPTAKWPYQPSQTQRPTAVLVTNDETSPIPVSGTFTAAASTATDTTRLVDDSDSPISSMNPLPVSGTFTSTPSTATDTTMLVDETDSPISSMNPLPIAGSVTVSNFPADTGTNVTIDAMPPISGTVGLNDTQTLTDTFGSMQFSTSSATVTLDAPYFTVYVFADTDCVVKIGGVPADVFDGMFLMAGGVIVIPRHSVQTIGARTLSDLPCEPAALRVQGLR